MLRCLYPYLWPSTARCRLGLLLLGVLLSGGCRGPRLYQLSAAAPAYLAAPQPAPAAQPPPLDDAVRAIARPLSVQHFAVAARQRGLRSPVAGPTTRVGHRLAGPVERIRAGKRHRPARDVDPLDALPVIGLVLLWAACLIVGLVGILSTVTVLGYVIFGTLLAASLAPLVVALAQADIEHPWKVVLTTLGVLLGIGAAIGLLVLVGSWLNRTDE